MHLPVPTLAVLLGALTLVACQSTPEPPPPNPSAAAARTPRAELSGAGPVPMAAAESGSAQRGVPARTEQAESALAALAATPTILDRRDGACDPGSTDRVWVMPRAPRPGEPLRLLAVSTAGAPDALVVTAPGAPPEVRPGTPAGGPPWSLLAGLNSPAAGGYRFEAMRDGQFTACTEVEVGGGPSERSGGDWDRATEAFYAVWVERLFDAPPEQSLSWPSLTPVLADARRNLLHNHLGANEDHGLVLEPDCADLSYILRAYFAWKLGLPIAYRACTRGSASSPPRCEAPRVETSLAGAPASANGFRDLSRRIMDTVHSGSGRVALADDATDFYPVPLERATLWPGTLFADPYGHTLILVKWVPQTAQRSGMLLAVDAQPDNSVSRKRFWEGTFLFAETPSAGPGFKAMRPLVRAGGAPRPLPNVLLGVDTPGAPYSAEQGRLSADAFYAQMEQLINPMGLDPASAYEETLEALMEQLQTRVASVERGESYMRQHRGQVMPMPAGAAIFETTGPWEDYATPARDMRLLIAMQVLQDLPERIRRYPHLYRLGGETPEQSAARIAALHEVRSQERGIEYRRSDGSPWRLTVAELYARKEALELAYNPNDCVERRWGAAAGSDEQTTCNRRAPREQQARMEEYRPWFRDRHRPPR